MSNYHSKSEMRRLEPQYKKLYEDLKVKIEVAEKALEKISRRCWNPGPDANSDDCNCNGCTARKARVDMEKV